MDTPTNTLVEIRTQFATDYRRLGAHFIRRHHITLYRESPLQWQREKMGEARVETLNVLAVDRAEIGSSIAKIFNTDSDWALIGRLLYNTPENQFQKDILQRFPSLEWNPNLAFIRQFRLLPAFRYAGWGRFFLNELKSIFRGENGALITFCEEAHQPVVAGYPLLPKDWAREEPQPAERLQKGLRAAGFDRLGHSALYLIDLYNQAD